MKRFMVLGLMAALILFVTAQAWASNVLSFNLTLQHQFLVEVPVSPTAVMSTTTKLKITTQDMLNLFASHYNETYLPGSTIQIGTMQIPNPDPEQPEMPYYVGILTVIDPDGETLTREIAPEVFKLHSQFGFNVGRMADAREDVVSGNARKDVMFVRFTFETGEEPNRISFEMFGISTETSKISFKSGKASASQKLPVTGEGFYRSMMFGESLVPTYIVLSGQITSKSSWLYVDVD